MKEETEKLAIEFFHLDLLSPAAARLLVDLEDDEPLAKADIDAINRELMDKPTFLGGLLRKRPRQRPNIARSRPYAYARQHPQTRPQAA